MAIEGRNRADNTEASFEKTRYLDPDLRNIKERIEGYSEAMREAKLSKFEQIILTDVVEVEGKMRALEPILASRDRPTAVFAATQLLILAALKFISQLRNKLTERHFFIGVRRFRVADCHAPVYFDSIAASRRLRG